MADIKTKTELAAEILQNLLDNGMISLEYGSEFFEQGKQEVIEEIKRKIDDYVILEGRVIEWVKQ